jgi:hypothetical protein
MSPGEASDHIQITGLQADWSFRGGYDEDELVRTAPGWRVAKRACIGAWFTPAPEPIFPGAEELAVPQ